MSEKSTKKNIGIAVAIAVLVIAIVGGVLFFVSGNNDTEKTPETTKAKTTAVEKTENKAEENEDKNDKKDQDMFVQTQVVIGNVNDDGTKTSSRYVYEWKEDSVLWLRYNSDGSKSVYNEFFFNSAGNMIKRTDFGFSDNVTGKIVCEEDKNGNIISEKTFYGKDLNCIHKYEYDSQGNNIKSTYYNSENLLCSQNEYDSKGNTTKSIEYNTDGSIARIYTYDKHENLISAVEYQSNEKKETIFKNEYEYDEAGNMIKETNYDENGKLSGWSQYEYDGENLLKESKYHGEGDLYSEEKYEYDSKNNLIKEIGNYYYNGHVKMVYECEYDEKSNIIKKVYHYNDKLDSITEYKYDEYGNLIKVESFDENGQLTYWYEYTWKKINNKGAFEFWESEVLKREEQFNDCLHSPADYLQY